MESPKSNTTITPVTQTAPRKFNLLRLAIRIIAGIDLAVAVIIFCMMLSLGIKTLSMMKEMAKKSSSSTTTVPTTTSTGGGTTASSTPIPPSVGESFMVSSSLYLVAKICLTILFFVSTSKSQNEHFPRHSRLFVRIGWLLMILWNALIGFYITLRTLDSREAAKTPFGVAVICIAVYLILVVIVLAVAVWYFSAALQLLKPSRPATTVTSRSRRSRTNSNTEQGGQQQQQQPSMSPSARVEVTVAGE